ncbi:amidohydrolase [Rhodoplanes sp. Z2-YC6860]|uniref:amidohydrolase n=1 Tax=Rhodoplanes sp. Z2-YC6860 TaxID=674703 RepID=UPI00078BC871|nr:amidohydrolase [Rhodoplanes sp. Z2-YC6860]AMN41045.1 TIM-barrel fold metal-dependent hydrolase [Rhodoplanes sp. Z2-YC6860]
MRLAFRATLFAIVGCLTLFRISAAGAQSSDTILINGKIVVYDAAPAQALAVRDGKIAAIGTTTEIRATAGPSTRVIDLGGRTVIPGLIDSHIHAIRAGLTWQTEVHWIGIRTLAEALDRLRAAAKTAPKGSWLIVAGGWTARQFKEDRRPTETEIAAAAPDHHVYVQELYSRVLLDPKGFAALGIPSDLASRITIERDKDGAPTGWLTGDNRAISELFDLLPRPDFAQKVAGTKAFFRALNAMGLTGVIDPGGYNLPIADYQPLFQIWRERALTLRVRYSLSAPRRDHELEDFQDLTQVLPMGFGDDWLRFNGIGENVTWGFYNNDKPTDAQKEQLADVLRWAVSRGMTAIFHWHNDKAVHHLLDVLERINAETPIRKLRWSIAHLNDASVESLARMKAMGVGWLMQNAFYFRGEAFLGQRGSEPLRFVPPIVTAAKMGVPIGGGTDAHRVMGPNPFVSLQWMLDSKTVGGTVMRGPEEIPSRIEALRIYTEGSAWFVFDEDKRAALAAGKLADLAVLDRDYLTVPVDEIGGIVSLLTMVGGRVVYAAGPFESDEDSVPFR